MSKMAYDQETRDLAHLAARRVSDAITSVLQLCGSPDQALQVALMAAGSALGSAAGAVTARHGCSHEEAKKVVVSLILESSSTGGRSVLTAAEGREDE